MSRVATSPAPGGRFLQPSPRLIASQRNGRLGGIAVTEKYGELFIQERGERGGTATRNRYGRAFYSFIAKLRWQREREK